jgi:hypothetical protein
VLTLPIRKIGRGKSKSKAKVITRRVINITKVTLSNLPSCPPNGIIGTHQAATLHLLHTLFANITTNP